MTRPIPVEIREAIVKAYQENLGTAVEIAEIFSIKPRSVFRFLKKKRETGDLSAEPIPGRPPILTDENLAIIKKIVLSNNDATLEQYRDQFYKETGIDVTIVTIHNACVILNLRRKKKFLRSGART
jgi:transposase